VPATLAAPAPGRAAGCGVCAHLSDLGAATYGRDQRFTALELRGCIYRRFGVAHSPRSDWQAGPRGALGDVRRWRPAVRGFFPGGRRVRGGSARGAACDLRLGARQHLGTPACRSEPNPGREMEGRARGELELAARVGIRAAVPKVRSARGAPRVWCDGVRAQPAALSPGSATNRGCANRLHLRLGALRRGGRRVGHGERQYGALVSRCRAVLRGGRFSASHRKTRPPTYALAARARAHPPAR